MIDFSVNIDRLSRELNELAAISDAAPPAVTRILFTDADLRARTFIKRLCADAGLSVREDAIGNTFARWTGSQPNLPAVGTGSHIDAIPNAGMYDGTVGVLGGLEAIRSLRSAGFVPKRSLELLLFTSEEPTRFGVGCIGSRALSGSSSAQQLAELRDSNGQRLDELRKMAGFRGDLQQVRLPSDYYSAFVELHIEQGPILERQKIDIGIVSAIAAPSAQRATIEGEGGHAGAVLMPDRRDALCAAAEIIIAVESAGKNSGSPDTVATTGVCRVHPDAINSVPDRVVLEIDIRDIHLESRDRVVKAVHDAINDVGKRRGVRVSYELLYANSPARMDDSLLATIEKSCQQSGATCQRMVSRAYHDSLFMSQICPTAMIFIPCRGGVSHRPDEFASPEAIRIGVQVLARTLAAISEI